MDLFDAIPLARIQFASLHQGNPGLTSTKWCDWRGMRKRSTFDDTPKGRFSFCVDAGPSRRHVLAS